VLTVTELSGTHCLIQHSIISVCFHVNTVNIRLQPSVVIIDISASDVIIAKTSCMTHTTSTGSLVVHDRLARYGGNYRVFKIYFTSIIIFGRSALFHAFRDKKKRGHVSLRPCSICHRVEWEPEKNASQSS
jgi:hypothetical protein